MRDVNGAGDMLMLEGFGRSGIDDGNFLPGVESNLEIPCVDLVRELVRVMFNLIVHVRLLLLCRRPSEFSRRGRLKEQHLSGSRDGGPGRLQRLVRHNRLRGPPPCWPYSAGNQAGRSVSTSTATAHPPGDSTTLGGKTFPKLTSHCPACCVAHTSRNTASGTSPTKKRVAMATA